MLSQNSPSDGDGGGGKTVGGRTKEALHALLWLEYGREDEGSRLEWRGKNSPT